jgi:hypothetical protein
MRNGNLVTTIEIKDKQGRVVATKEVVTYAGLLNRAHQEGLKKVIIKLIQAPSKDNEMTAISMAKVVTEKGVFIECGDANPTNVNSKIIPHIIRMSVTRAKARAMRDAVNIGVISLEEMAEESGNGNGNGNGNNSQRPPSSEDSKAPGDAEKPMSVSQRKYLFKLLEERGKSAEDAQTWLTRAFEIENLDKITRKMASDMINHLLSLTNLPEEQVHA